MPAKPSRRPSGRQLRAMAYAIADEVESRALAMQSLEPRLSRAAAINRALAAMAAA